MKTILAILILTATLAAQKPATTPAPATPVTPAPSPVTLSTPTASPASLAQPLKPAVPVKGGVKINRAEQVSTPEYRLVHDGPKVISLFKATNLTLTKYTIERCPTKQACLDLATQKGWTIPGPVLAQSQTPQERQTARAQVNAARQAKAQAARDAQKAKAAATAKITPKTTPPVNVSVPPR